MNERLALCIAVIIAVVGFFRGAWLYSMSDAILALQGTVAAVLILLCAPLSLYLGIATWRRKKGVLSYVILVATSGIAGVALGLSLMFWVLD